MKRLALLAAVLALPLALAAQVTTPTASVTQPANGPADIAGQLYAANFAHWTIKPSELGLSWTSPSQCYGTSGGVNFKLFSTTAPITIVDVGVPANTETVTPTIASYNGAGCSVGLPATHAHSNYYLQSGTLGLQEALNWLGADYGQVVLTPDWTAMGGTSGMISAAVLGANATILDQRGTISYTTSTAAAAPGTLRALTGAIATSGASYANGSNSIVGVRGSATVAAATTASSGYIYGGQGKLTVAGTLNGSQWTFGNFGQLDISAAQGLSTNPAGAYLAPLWSDAGATGPSVTCASCNMFGLTNTTATTFNSLLFTAAKANYFVDAANATNSGGWFASSSASANCTTTYLLKISTPSGAGYIHVCSN